MSRAVSRAGFLLRAFAALLALALLLASAASVAQRDDWKATLDEARGQTVYFNAWGGDLAINRYIEWAAAELRERHDIELRHVKVSDIAEAVTRILAERAAGRDRDGSVDLLWINGENFAALKRAGLLHGPWVDELPNGRYVNWQGNPTTRTDATLPIEGFEMPWGTSALTLFFDSARTRAAPDDPAALLQWIEKNPGRFSYPQPPAFLGSAFLKQLLELLVDNPERLQEPVRDDFDAVTRPLWDWLDRAHASMWRRGRLFPLSGPAQRDLLAVGELDWMLSYNPAEARRAYLQDELHAGIVGMQFSGGALANSHFLAIPENSSAKAAAKVTSDFLLSAEAQARKADETWWGDPTVLDVESLDATQRAYFSESSNAAAVLPLASRFVLEPHSSWTALLEKTWLERYGH